MPIPIQNVDRMPNEAGPITEVVDIILCYKGHSKHAVFAVTVIRQEDVTMVKGTQSRSGLED
jgi:hypothetical protein